MLVVTDQLKASFQFQIGAIKSALPEPITPDVNEFQFQIGAIKSEADSPSASVIVCFNSKLVRLKVSLFANCLPLLRVSIPNWCD